MVAFRHVLFTAFLFVVHVSGQSIPSIDPSVASKCQKQCTALENSLVGCTSVNCVCNDSVISQLASCLNCGVHASGSPITQSQAQTSLNDVVQGCNDAGSPVKSVSINGAIRPSTAGAGLVTLVALGAVLAAA